MSWLLDRLASLPQPLPWLAAVLLAALLGLALQRTAMASLRLLARRSGWPSDGVFPQRLGHPLQLVLSFASLRALGAAFPERAPAAALAALTVALILSLAWLASRLTLIFEHAFFRRLDLDAADNLRARRMYTQVRFLRRAAVLAICVLSGAAVMLSFDSLRQLGAAMLTSAGIAGIVVGFAAQRTVGNLIAGFQIAFTQPIRVDDVVVVEGEWGRIEEITLTYVVVRIWDERRLVLPIAYFIENPFENWTRVSAELLGSVFLHVDYRVSIDDLRAELERVLRASPHWDGRVSRVHVTEAREHTLEVRVLVSAHDSPTAFDLRCEVREALVRYLQAEHPESLPRVRGEIAPAAAARNASLERPPVDAQDG